MLTSPLGYPQRVFVEADKLSPQIEYKNYDPWSLPSYTSCHVRQNASDLATGGGWADSDHPAEYELAHKRYTFYGAEETSDGRSLRTLSEAGLVFLKHPSLGLSLPLNPWIRTGLGGRGNLGKWGPNHAADPIVIRFNRSKLLLEFVAIKRHDNGEWAIPGGMVDAGEYVTETLKREFKEEAGSKNSAALLDSIFSDGGHIVFQGCNKLDNRTTDFAWIETSVRLFFPNNNETNELILTTSAESPAVKWMAFADMCEHTMFSDHQRYLNKAHIMAQPLLHSMIFKWILAQEIPSIAEELKKRKRLTNQSETYIS